MRTSLVTEDMELDLNGEPVTPDVVLGHMDMRAFVPALRQVAGERGLEFEVGHARWASVTPTEPPESAAIRVVLGAAPDGIDGMTALGDRPFGQDRVGLGNTWGVGWVAAESDPYLVTIPRSGADHDVVAFQVYPEHRALVAPWFIFNDCYRDHPDLAEDYWEPFMTALNEAVDLVDNPDEDQMRERSAAALAATLRQRSSGERRRVAEAVESSLASLRDLERRHAVVTQELEEQRLHLRALDEAGIDENAVREKAEVEFEALAANEDVARFFASPSGLRVITKELPMRVVPDHPDADDYGEGVAGAFTIHFDFADHAVKIENRTRKIGRWDHPHVNYNQLCLGNQRDLVNGLMKRHEYSATVAVIVDLLKQVNPDDTYDSSLWPAWFEEYDDINTEDNS